MFCTPFAAAADACFESATPGRALCLVDPFSKSVFDYALKDTFAAVSARADPQPIGLILDNGDRCRMRISGVGQVVPDAAPDYVGHYWCEAGDSPSLFGPKYRDGIDQSTPMWTVQYGRMHGPLTTVGVVEAFYTGRAE